MYLCQQQKTPLVSVVAHLLCTLKFLANLYHLRNLQVIHPFKSFRFNRLHLKTRQEVGQFQRFNDHVLLMNSYLHGSVVRVKHDLCQGYNLRRPIPTI